MLTLNDWMFRKIIGRVITKFVCKAMECKNASVDICKLETERINGNGDSNADGVARRVRVTITAVVEADEDDVMNLIDRKLGK